MPRRSSIDGPSSTQLEALLAAAPDAMLILAGDGTVVLANERLADLFGYAVGDLIGTSIEHLVPSRYRQRHARHRDRYFATPQARPMGTPGLTLFGLRADGTEFPVEISLSPLTIDGRTAVVAAVRDGTERRKVEDRFRRLLEAAPDAMVISDGEGTILLVNEQVSALFGYAADELMGRSVETLIPERYRKAHPAHREQYFANPRTRPMGVGGLALFGLRKDGSEFPAEISLSPLETDEGRVAITAIRDVSERKEAEEQRARLVQAHESIRLRDEFLSVASHELKTPVTSLGLQAAALKAVLQQKAGQADPERAYQQLGRIEQSVHRLTTLINQLLDVSKITGGRLTLTRETIDLSAIVRDAAEQFQDALERTGAELRLRMESGVSVWGDPTRVEEIVCNLLSNAIKYGGGKPIEVTLDGGGNDGMAHLTVRDHGIGIDAADQARIFERFERVLSQQHHGGVGLGLWIVRQLIEAHGGSIRVWSQPNAGSEFTVELPQAATPATVSETEPTETGKRPFVMIVDDDQAIRDSLFDFLSMQGIAVHCAASGREALQLLRDGMQPRVILLDLMMPEMDGWEFRENLLRDRNIPDIPVIVLSAVPDLERRVATLSVAGHLKKPVEPAVLLRTLAAFDTLP